MLATLIKRYSPLLLFILVPALALYQVSFGLYAMKYDLMNQFFPCRYFISECLSNHTLPLWCPYINFGYPFHADPQGGMFYPLTSLISIVIGYNVYTVQLEYLLHVAIAGLGFYLLLRSFGISFTGSLVFGVVYSLSGVFVSNAQHLTWIITLAWLPFILLSFQKYLQQPSFYHVVLLALFLSLAVTGGYIGILIIAAYFFLGYFIFHIGFSIKHKGAKALWPVPLSAVFGGLLFLLLAGAYLFSFGDSLEYIARGKPVTLEQANGIPLSPRAAISFLFPFANSCQSYALDTDISMANIYCGFLLLPLLFITLFKAKLNTFQKALFLFGMVCLCAALGKYFIVRSFLYHFFPGLNLLRHAAIFRVFGILGLLAVVPSGFDWWKENLAANWVRNLLLAWSGLLITVLVICFIKDPSAIHVPAIFSSTSIGAFNATQSVWHHILLQAAIQLLLLAAVLVLAFVLKLSPKLKLAGIGLVLMADIALAAQLNMVSTVICEVKAKDLQAKLDALPKGFPVPAIQPVENFTEFGNWSTNPIWFNYSMFEKIPAINGFNSFYLSDNEAFNNSADKADWIKKPLVFFSDTAATFSIGKFAPGEVSVSYNTANACELTLLQSMYKGWSAAIDAKPVEIKKQHDYFMSCAVPAGSHEVRFVYERDGVKMMYFLSLLLFAACGGFVIQHKLKQLKT